MSKITTQQMDALRLIKRSRAGEDGWVNCAPKLFKAVVEPMPTELVERRQVDGKHQARLTVEAQYVLKWLG